MYKYHDNNNIDIVPEPYYLFPQWNNELKDNYVNNNVDVAPAPYYLFLQRNNGHHFLPTTINMALVINFPRQTFCDFSWTNPARGQTLAARLSVRE